MDEKAKQLRAMFPRGSTDFFAVNASVSSGEPEQNVRPTVVDAPPGKEKGDARIIVSIVMYRVRTLDPDNATGAVKPLVDCLRQVNLIPDDTGAHINLQVSQEKVNHYNEQRTELHIKYP